MALPTTTLEVSEVRATRDTETTSRGNIIAGPTTYEVQFASGGYAVIDRAEFERLASLLAGDR